MEIKRIIVGPIITNCYLISDNGELAIIDPGEDAPVILAEIKKIEAKPLYIINTHYHYDHVTANAEIKRATGAKVLIHEAEKEFIDFPVDRFLHTDDIIKIGNIELKVINTPGHSKGSICLLGEDFIFTGDTLFSDGYGRTDLAGGSEEEMNESLERLEKIITPGMTVYPGHGDIYQA